MIKRLNKEFHKKYIQNGFTQSFLNADILADIIENYIYDEYSYLGEDPNEIDDIDVLHDMALNGDVGGIRIEEYDKIYWDMVALLNSDGEDIMNEVNMFIGDECQSYYLDPAFSSARDYWSYILG